MDTAVQDTASRGQPRQQCSQHSVNINISCCIPNPNWVRCRVVLPRRRLGGVISHHLLCCCILRLLGYLACFGIRSRGDDDGISTTVVRNSAQVVVHSAMLLLLQKGPNMVASPEVGWVASSAVLLVAGYLLCFVFHFRRAVLLASSFCSFFSLSFVFIFSLFFVFFLLQ